MRYGSYIYIWVLLLAGCGYDRLETDGSGLPPAGLLPDMEIGDLVSYYRGSPLRIDDPIVVAGYVTANDASDNFYRTVVIEDATGAVEIKVGGSYHLHNKYAVNRRIVVRCGGLTLGGDNGVRQLGRAAPASSRYQTDFLGHEIVADRYLVPDNVFAQVVPRTAAIRDLNAAMCGSLVRIEGVRPDAGQGETWALTAAMTGGAPQTAYRQFRDAAGDSLNVVTSGYASFAASPLPQGAVSLTGILQYGPRGSGRAVYMLKLRDLHDVE